MKIIEQVELIRTALATVAPVQVIGISADITGPRIHVWDVAPIADLAGTRPHPRLVGEHIHRSVSYAGVTWADCRPVTQADIDRLIGGQA